jgi:hypothetical protein
MLGRALLEWSMLSADDDDLRAGTDIVDAGVVVPIAMPVAESRECLVRCELPWHRLLPLKFSDHSDVRREGVLKERRKTGHSGLAT